MTQLPPPPARSQKDAPDADNWEFCGETDIGCALTACGISVDTETVAMWMRAQFGESGVRMGTNAGEVVAGVQHFGGTAHSEYGPARPMIDGALSRGHYVILAVYSDGRGNINGSRQTGHWVLVWGRDASSYDVMNSLGDPVFGMNRQYALAAIENNNQGVGVEIDMTPTGGDEVDNEAQQAVHVLLRGLAGTTDAAADLGWDSQYDTAIGGIGSYVGRAFDGSDPKMDPQLHKGLNILRALASGQIPDALVPAIKALIPAPAPSGAAPHTHTIGGSTGPAQ